MSERRGWAVGWAFAVGLLSAWLSTPVVSQATTIRLINHDGPNEGFNDATPALPVGGNPGTTIGAQRLIAFQRALDLWGAQLDSPIEIRVGATFDDLTCNSTSVTLGTAGPTSVFRDFVGAPLPDTWYPAALADHLAGMDMAPGEDDIDATFNSRFGTTCTFPAGWYYGLDGSPPGDDSDLVTVVLHEIGHGLGFLSLIDIHNGSRFADDTGTEHNDMFMSFLVDDETGKHFDEMTDAERRSALVDTGHLKWDGEDVVQSSTVLTSGVDSSGRVEMYAPAQPQDGSSVSHWSDELFPDELMEPFFTHAIHDVGLAGAALLDIGWGSIVTPICEADCDRNGIVSVTELVSSVRIALGTSPLSACPAADADQSGTVAVNELVGAVDRALKGCP